MFETTSRFHCRKQLFWRIQNITCLLQKNENAKIDVMFWMRMRVIYLWKETCDVKRTKLNGLERGHFELFGIRQQMKPIISKVHSSKRFWFFFHFWVFIDFDSRDMTMLWVLNLCSRSSPTKLCKQMPSKGHPSNVFKNVSQTHWKRFWNMHVIYCSHL